jgi:sjoegren syndrome nuclear autoantigen 1
MADKGAELQGYNSELVLALEDLKERQLDLRESIRVEEGEREQLLEELRTIQDRLQRVEHSLTKKRDRLEGYDRTISETEEAFVKILESSQTLLHLLKRERVTLNDGRGARPGHTLPVQPAGTRRVPRDTEGFTRTVGDDRGPPPGTQYEHVHTTTLRPVQASTWAEAGRSGRPTEYYPQDRESTVH